MTKQLKAVMVEVAANFASHEVHQRGRFTCVTIKLNSAALGVEGDVVGVGFSAYHQHDADAVELSEKAIARIKKLREEKPDNLNPIVASLSDSVLDMSDAVHRKTIEDFSYDLGKGVTIATGRAIKDAAEQVLARRLKLPSEDEILNKAVSLMKGVTPPMVQAKTTPRPKFNRVKGKKLTLAEIYGVDNG